jgi:hypothetical protein
MAKPYPTVATQLINRNPNKKKKPNPRLATLTLSVPFVDIPNDPANQINYSFAVLRQGGNVGVSDAVYAVVPAAGSGIPAAYFGGSYPTGPVHFVDGQGQQTCIISVPPGPDLAADTFAHIVLSGFVNCTPGPVTDVTIRAPGAVATPDYVVSVTMPIVVLTRDDLIDEAYSVVVTRVRADGDYSQACSVQLVLTGSGAHPIQGSDLTGGLLNTTVNFGAGDTEKDFTITVKAGADPTTDLTGDVAISAPSGCKISPTAASVAVKIPQASIISPDVLPPEYLDPDFTNLTPYGAACTLWSQVQTQCADLSNNPLCKTKYVKLAASYVDTVIRNFNYKGYVDPVTKLIYPLIVTGDITKANSRAPADINNRPHFNAGTTLNGAVWLWLYALAAEYPFSGGFQPNTAAAVNMDNSTDCLVTRCWLDAPCAIMSGGGNTTKAAVRPRVGGNDCYGTWNGGSPQPWTTKLRFVFSGKTTATQDRTLRAYIYQNFLGNCRAPFEAHDATACFYAGEGLSPALSEPVDYPNAPYDLNWRESWFFNNLIMSTANYLIYNKHACNVWRNRVVSINNWTDITGTGSPFHLIACRGGNWTGGTVKYNVVEASGGHNDLQSWWGTAEFNDWGGQPVNVFIHCNDPSKLADGRFSKTLLAASHWRFRSNKNGKYQIGTARPDAGYQYYAPIIDTSWEGEVGCTWNWEATYTITGVGTTTYNPSGTPLAWGVNGKNTETGQIKFPGDTFKTVAAAGQLTKSGTSTAVRQLTDATAANGFTKAEKGIVSQEGLVWDGIGTGNGGGGGGGGGNYDLIQSNFTLHFPSDNMAVDYPNVVLNWLGSGGFECKAGRGNALDSPHVCLRMWLKTAPPNDAATFTFYYTRLDNLTAADSDGVFSLFTERYKGTAAYGADPNGWAKTSWRTHPSFISGSDLLYRERGLGYRHSFANRNQTPSATMQFRLRAYNAATDGGTQIFDTTGYTADNVNGGSTFDFPLNVRCKVEVVRNGNRLVCKRTRMDTGVIQEWDFNDALIGTGGRAPGGWCGFGFYLGAWGRVEPVPGVPFVQAGGTNPLGPYPASTLWQQLAFTGSAHSFGVNADQWPTTTYTNGNVCAAWGDGYGFNNNQPRSSLGISEISGTPPSLTGVDKYLSGTTGVDNRKPNAILHIHNIAANTILLWYVNQTKDARVGTYTAISTNNGTSWTFHEAAGERVFSTAASPKLQVIGAVQLGPGYLAQSSGLDTDYVYLYLNNSGNLAAPFTGTNGDIWMCRVRIAGAGGSITNIWNPTKYSFFNGLDGAGAPTWTADGGALNLSKTVAAFPGGMGKHFLNSWSEVNTRFLAALTPTATTLAVYEAPTPFGPWGTLYYGAGSDPSWTGIFTASLPGPWQTAGTAWVAVSGAPPDSLDVQSSPLVGL